MKKNASIIFNLVATSALLVGFSSCNKKKEAELAPCCKAAALKAGAASDSSIYQLDSLWENAEGEKLKLVDLGGRVQVLTMGYSTCKYACPKLLSDMLVIKSELPESLLKKVNFTFVSIDPEVDTAARLRAYAKENSLDESQWNLLRGDKGAVQELAVVLGIKYRKTTPNDYAHSNVIVVLDKKGNILHRQEGLNGNPEKTVQTILNAQ